MARREAHICFAARRAVLCLGYGDALGCALA